jgi:hypothetical protein
VAAIGFQDGAQRVVRGTFPSAGLVHQVVPHLPRAVGGEEPFDYEDAGCRPLPCWGGQGAHRASGGRVFRHEAGVRALAR